MEQPEVRLAEWAAVGNAGSPVPAATPATSATLALVLVGTDTTAPTARRTTREQLNRVVAECAATHRGAGAVAAEEQAALATFARASDAIGCAIELQRRLAAGSKEARAAIAVHTGEVEVDGAGRYRGDAVVRCSRLRELAHGGQILVSRAASELVLDHLPTEVTLVDLGNHDLRGLRRPERIAQVCHPELDSEFPPLASAGRARHNLPAQLTTFIGRTSELAELAEIIGRERLLTLTGAGGCGKTRLALQLADQLRTRFADGVWWVDLGPIADAALVASSAAAVLSVRELANEKIAVTLARQLEDRQLLLVLDNCEHLLGASADLVERLLRACPAVTVLTTSREPLAVTGEALWRVSSLPFPVDDSTTTDPIVLAGYDAVQLFVDRAARVRPNFHLTDENAAGVALVCRRLDGIPLALELAAAQVRVLAPQQIADELVDSFRLLTGGGRGALSRQQTLEASVEWSYQLLHDDERRLLARLAVFAGGFTLEAAEAVCAGNGIERYHVLDLLGRLVDKSLVQADEEVGTRYRLLETIRHFAHRHLGEWGDVAATRDRHLRYFAGLAAELETSLEGFGWHEALSRLTTENDNLRAAIGWGLQSQDPEPAIQIVGDLYQYWHTRGHFAEGLAWCDAAFEHPAPDAPATLAACLGAAGLCSYTADFAGADRWAREALRVAHVLDDRRGIGRALNALAFPTMYLDPPARPLYEEAIAIHREVDDQLYLAASLFSMAYVEMNAGDLTAARRCAEESVSVARSVGGHVELLGGLNFLGWAASAAGDYPAAEAAFGELIAAAHELGESFWDSLAVAQLAGVAVWTGEHDRAAGLLEEALGVGRESGNIYTVGAALWYQGELAAATGDYDGAAERLQEALPLLVVMPHNWIGAVVQARLGDVAAAQADGSTAVAAWESAHELARASGNPVALGRAWRGLARAACRRDDLHRAEELVHDALSAALGCGEHPGAIAAIEQLGVLAVDLESWVEGARLLAAADRARSSIGGVPGALDVAYIAPVRERVQLALGEDQFAQAWSEGTALTLEAAAAYAGKRRGARGRPSAGWAALTPTELQVAGLVAEGLSNPAIAERLFVTRGTVKVHVSHILGKLGLANRTELAAVTIRRGIEPTA